MEHVLKTWPTFFRDVASGKKTFEVRKDDRPFAEGDTLLLREYASTHGDAYTGREVRVRVTYLTPLEPWAPGMVGMSIQLVAEGDS